MIKKVSKDFYIFILMIISLGSSLPTLSYLVSKFLDSSFDIYGTGIFSFTLFLISLIYLSIRAKRGRLNLDFLVRYEEKNDN